MSDQPILITEHDVAEKPLLLRALRKVTDRLIMLGGRLSRLESAAQLPSVGQIRRELEATGSQPLYVGNLLGQLAEPQPAKVTHYETEPTGGTLQNMRDGQLVTVGTTSTGDNIYRVIGGNPNTLRPIQIGAASAPANMVTTNTTQNIGTGAAKAVKDNWQFDAMQDFNAGIEVNAGGITVGSTGGQFDSAAQYSAFAYASTSLSVVGTVSVAYSTGIIQNQGGVFNLANPTRLAAQDSGIYAIGGQIVYFTSSTSTADRRVVIQVGGVSLSDKTFIPVILTGATFYSVGLPTVIKLLASTDYAEMFVTNNGTSTSETVGGVGQQTYLFLHKVC